jgi:GNAT superfamily N-acetyltransferase
MKTAPALTARLREPDRAALEAHFLALGSEDRRLRFGAPIPDEVVQAYVARIDFVRDGAFAVQDDAGRIAAAVHVAFTQDSAELGLSVLPDFRGQGLGNALFARAVTHLRNRGAREVFVHCLTENGAMMHLARKHRMRIVQEGGETDARLAVDPPDAFTFYDEWMRDCQVSAVQAFARYAAAWSQSPFRYSPSGK